MWVCVDRIEKDTVILVSDEEKVYCLPAADYARLTGKTPAESDVLTATLEGDRLVAASYDEVETAARKAAARARLDWLFGKS